MIDFTRETVETWLARSRKGEVCAAVGCTNKPVEQCPHCEEWYCEVHKYALSNPVHQAPVEPDRAKEGKKMKFKRRFPCTACGHALIAYPEPNGGFELICACPCSTHTDKLSPTAWELLESDEGG